MNKAKIIGLCGDIKISSIVRNLIVAAVIAALIVAYLLIIIFI